MQRIDADCRIRLAGRLDEFERLAAGRQRSRRIEFDDRRHVERCRHIAEARERIAEPHPVCVVALHQRESRTEFGVVLAGSEGIANMGCSAIVDRVAMRTKT